MAKKVTWSQYFSAGGRTAGVVLFSSMMVEDQRTGVGYVFL